MVPERPDGARQRAGDRRPLRAVRPAGRGAPARAVVLPHHRLRRPAARRPRHDRVARARQGDAAQLDRPQRGRRGRRSAARSSAIDYPVFTTRPDTLFGATFFVMAPEHPDVFTAGRRAPSTSSEVHDVRQPARCTESAEERGDVDKPKTGVPLGRTVTNPVNGEQIPMFVADYVLMEYGTGAIMAVPAHDQRDYDFADGVRPADPPGGGARGRRRTPDARRRRSWPTPTTSGWSTRASSRA